jgi:hypothetical protein
MCLGVSLRDCDIPSVLVARHGLARRAAKRADRIEFQFLYSDRRPRLPVIRHGRLQVVRWGNGRGQSRFLPRTGWTWLETVEAGGWRNLPCEPVEIPASYALERRGVWYLVERGVRGLLVPDERGAAVAYVVCEPSSHYYRIMTGSDRMPVLIEQRI